eukprot:COSAG05_NODE_5622_length_1128_cov_1.343052_1_plen_293_part_10
MALMMLLGLGAHRAHAVADYSTITWTTPTIEPQHNTKDQAIISGGMPVGNGETALLVFPLVPPPVPVPKCTFEAGADYNTGLGQPVPADSREACCVECMKTAGCTAAVWVAGGNTCWLKEGALHKAPNSNPAVTGCLLPPNASAPAIVPAPAPPPCKGKLVGGTYCNMGKFIGCHDMSCQLKGGEQNCAATTMAACELEVATVCDKTPTCVAFSIMHAHAVAEGVVGDTHFVYELAHSTGCVLQGFPDTDWEYFVKAKPWPVPSPGGCHSKPAPPPPPAPESMGNFTLPNSVS